MSHIFISYSRKDLGVAEKIINALAKDNLEPWIDWKSIPKGEEFEREIQQGIEEAEAFLFLVSPDSVQSDWCNKEITHAMVNGKRILPIIVRSTHEKLIPSAIIKRNWIFCREGQDDFDAAIQETYETIHMDYEWLRFHTRLQTKALEWERTKDTSRLLRGKELGEAEEQLTEAGDEKDPKPTDLQRNFLLNSQRIEKQQRRRLTIGLSIGLVIVAILAILAWQQRNLAVSETNAKATALVNVENARATAQLEKEHAEEQALIANSRHLSSVAKTILETRTDLALLLAVEAAKMNWNFSTLDGLFSVLHYETVPYAFFYGHKKPVSALTFSNDGMYIASASEDQTIRVWNKDSRQAETVIDVGFTATALEFTSDGRYILIGIHDAILAWDLQESDWMGQFSTGHEEKLNGLAFDPAGNKLAISYDDGKILLFDFRSANLFLEIDAPYGIECLAFTVDGTILAGASGVNVFTWNTDTGEMLNSYYEFGGMAEGLLFSPDNELYAYGSWQEVLQIRKVETGEVIRSFKNRVEWFTVEALSDDRQWLVTSGFGEWTGNILLWDVTGTQQTSFVIGSHSESIGCLDISPNDQYLVSSGGGENIQIWNRDTNFQQPMILSSTDSTKCAKFYSNDLIITFAEDNIIRQFDIHANKQTGTILEIANEILNIDILNNLENLIAITTCTKKDDNDRCLDKEIQYYDLESRNEVKSFFIESNGGNSSLSSTGNLYAVANPEPEFYIKLWELSSEEAESKILLGPYNWILKIGFSPDEKKVVASSQGDGIIYIWDLESGQTDGEMLVGHDYLAWALAFSPDSKLLVSGGCNQRSGIGCLGGEIRIWDVDTKQIAGRPLTTTHDDWVNHLIFSHDGNILISGDLKGGLRVWQIGFDAWVEHACQRASRNFTHAEWRQYIGENIPYHATCPSLPILEE
jgi:WD40 repeat protein